MRLINFKFRTSRAQTIGSIQESAAASRTQFEIDNQLLEKLFKEEVSYSRLEQNPYYPLRNQDRLNVILFGSGDEEGGSLLFLRVCASKYFWRRDKKYTYNLEEKKIHNYITHLVVYCIQSSTIYKLSEINICQ
jgi:hypothetical protein